MPTAECLDACSFLWQVPLMTKHLLDSTCSQHWCWAHSAFITFPKFSVHANTWPHIHSGRSQPVNYWWNWLSQVYHLRKVTKKKTLALACPVYCSFNHEVMQIVCFMFYLLNWKLLYFSVDNLIFCYHAFTRLPLDEGTNDRLSL